MYDVSIDDFFSENSSLKTYIPDYKPRVQQLEMAKAVAKTLSENKSLIVEAGTGTGKTFAYLIPALMSGKKILISTGTKNLQDQLFHRDLPLLCKALKKPVKISLLKGRRNYLCHYRIQKNSLEGRFPSKELTVDFFSIANTASQTKLGEIAEFKNISEESQVWNFVTSTHDNCLGQECDYIHQCFVAQARKKAQTAEVIVVNHHLFFADLMLRDVGFGELLPGVDAIIFDEAHQLPEIAQQFFGEVISTRQLVELSRDAIKEIQISASDMPEIMDVLMSLQSNAQAFRSQFPKEPQRKPWQDIMHKAEFQTAINMLIENIAKIRDQLSQISVRSKGLENCGKRSAELLALFKKLTEPTPSDQIHWYETFMQSVSLHHTPLKFSEEFNKQLKNLPAAMIFTSATLTVNNDFNYFLEQLGLHEAEKLQLDGVFDYQKQTKLYVPQSIADPNSGQFISDIIKASVPVIKAARGRTFFLFTSYYVLQAVAKQLAMEINYPILIQGQMPKTKLLDKFRQLGDAVLLATNSFWEGVDVKGEALSCVIIDKLPFSSPSDPILKAQIQTIRNAGGDPFTQIQLHHAVLSLKQGAGRLIRDETDRGVLMICDPRIINKPYGKTFLNSLPAMPLIRSLEEVEAFFA
ncbi:MAG: ATP-dependent DNA helicase [Gammaproteobacteria bacterium]